MTATANEIDAAIENVVKTGSDPEALTEAVRALAGVLGYDLAPKPAIVHRYFGGHWEGNVYVAACGQPDRSHHDRIGVDVNCPGCLKTWGDSGCETEPDPTPRDGDHGTCAVCGNEIRYYGIASLEGYGARWMHEQGTADGHDAELGGSA